MIVLDKFVFVAPAGGRLLSQYGEQIPQRPAAVADGILLVRGHLGESAVETVGHKHRVVAEPVGGLRG